MPQQVDYLIVGGGIASICFAKCCLENNKSFHMVADLEQSASHVAAGLFNPIVIKRFNPVWRFQHQMALLQKTFAEFESLLGGNYLHHAPVYRIFSNAQEIKTWQDKIASTAALQDYMNPHPIANSYKHIEAPFGFGEVKGTGWVDLAQVLRDFNQSYQHVMHSGKFDYAALHINQGFVYQGIHAHKIIFAEGVKVHHNPFFNFIPIRPNKGEILIIKIVEEMPQVIFNSKNFLMPLGEQLYYVGSTYDRIWEDAGPTLANREKLLDQLRSYYKGDFEVIDHRAGFRPTTPNMRPIVGNHPMIDHMYVLNGLGTRGTFNAPDMARELFEWTTSNIALDKEINVSRYYKHMPNTNN